MSIFGIEWEAFSSKQLCAICSKLSIKGARNVKKPDMDHRICSSTWRKKNQDNNRRR